MGLFTFEPKESVHTTDIASAAELLMIHCRHLASDIIGIAESGVGLDPDYARVVSRQLSHLAGELAVAVHKIRAKAASDLPSAP